MSQEEKESKIVSYNGQPVHLTVTKNTKGRTWEISVHSETPEKVLEAVRQIDTECEKSWGDRKGEQQ